MGFINYNNGITLRDVVYAAAIGDALGVPYEFLDRGTFECTDMVGYGTHNQPAGTWSDDTSMILATCKSLKDNDGEIVISDIFNNFEKWLRKAEFTAHNEVFDIGNATYKAITTGEPCIREYENGNGSLMRIAPLAFVDCTDDDVRDVSAITHGHYISTEACVIFVNLLKEMLFGASLSDMVHALELSAPFDRLSIIDTLPEEEIKSSGFVVHTLEAAIWCVLTSNDLKGCLLKAVNLGSDTDTTACVAGAIGVVQFGMESIQKEWVEKTIAMIEQC